MSTRHDLAEAEARILAGTRYTVAAIPCGNAAVAEVLRCHLKSVS